MSEVEFSSSRRDAVRCRENVNAGKKDVILHDDDEIYIEYVIIVLMSVFDKSKEQAYELAMEANNDGTALIGTYWSNVADSKVEQVNQMNRESGFNLLVTANEVE